MNEWKTVRLGDVCEILNGYAFKSDKYVDSGIRVIRITNVQKGFIEDNSPAFYPITEKETLKDYELHENDLLISLTGNVGRIALLSKEMLPAALNQRVGCIRIRDKNLLISYLFTFLNSDKFESDCIYSARGIAQKNMSTEWLKNYLIPLPPIEVQIKIANNLNTCSKIIKKHNKQLNNFDLLIKSRFIEMFGDIIQNTKNWELKNFTEIAKSRLGKMLDSKKQTGKEKYPYLANFNVQWFRFNLENLNEMDFSEADRIEFALKDGDLLVCEGGEVGRCAVWHNQIENCFFQKAVHRVRLNMNLVHPDYMAYWFKFRSDFNSFDDIVGSKATIAHLTGEKLKLLQIPVPPLSLQNDFAAFVQQIGKSKFAVQKSLEKTETLYKSLMQRYFA